MTNPDVPQEELGVLLARLVQAKRDEKEARHALEVAREALRQFDAEHELMLAGLPVGPGPTAGHDHGPARPAETPDEHGAARPALLAAVERREREARTTAETLQRVREVVHRRTDPSENVARFSDSTPFLLFPLRLETRFRTISNPEGPRHQLWVRLYPDECLVDAFEPVPSVGEITSTQRYWTRIWSARGIESRERAAWRALVAAHGSGRAGWLVANYRPLNPDDKPADPADNVIALVIPTEASLGADEAGWLRDYWAAVWLADGKKADLEQALSDFRAAVDDDSRAAELAEGYQPTNLADNPPAPLRKTDMTVKVGFVVFLKSADIATKRKSWSQPARTAFLPERFMLLGYSGGATVIEETGNVVSGPLMVGPDPEAAAADQIRQEDGEIVVGDDLRWLVDFDRAVEEGMGFRVDLPAAVAAAGFDRLIVVGVRLSSNAEQARLELETLLAHHRDGSSGFSVIPQGLPTNNTEEAGSGFTRADEADASFDQSLHPGPALSATAAWDNKRDGEWLAESLGIDVALLDTVANSRGTDQIEAQAMNVALWPATLGYSLETMLNPMFDRDQVDAVRWFFTRLVSGRGLVPPVRIGRQPYGILPTAALSRLRWPLERDLSTVAAAGMPESFPTALRRLYGVLSSMDADWKAMAAGVSHVGKAGDAHQILLDILGLHPNSVEYYQRYAESVEDLYNRMGFWNFGTGNLASLISSLYTAIGMQLLRKLGYTGDAQPDVLRRLFLEGAQLLQGPAIQEGPLSELDPLRPSTADDRNYLEWLHDAAETSLEVLRQEQGFTGGAPPKALLYLLLRHALLQAYWEASLQLHETRGVLDSGAVKEACREAPFIHIQGGNGAGQSRWAYLYAADARITGDPGRRVGDFITASIGAEPSTNRLSEIVGAVKALQGLPTARLERLFAEHLDCCSYRLDAWQQGILHYGLARMRYQREGNAVTARRGILLGAFGWLEDVRPRKRQLTPVRLEPELAETFQPDGSAPLLRDSTNGGYVHAPSLNQAVAAAVLRNGYMANSSPGNPQTLALNLSSQRVRVALSVLEGIREGQSLGALLGYQFERGLHDRHGLGEVDEFIYALRKQFPLRAERHPDTSTPEDVPIEAVEARNVMDGLRLLDHLKTQTTATYPFGLDLPEATDPQATAINLEVDRLLDTSDALADLSIAESVYQAVQSNYEGVASTLDTSSTAHPPPEPAFISTPRSGRTLTHRVAVQLQAGLDEDTSPFTGLPVSPRARAEPALNHWLGGMLPAAGLVACTVTYFDPAANALQTQPITQAQLGLEPIDLLYVASLEGQQAMTELDDRVLRYAHEHYVPRPDSAVSISYLDKVAGSFTFFEQAALIRTLRPLLLQARELRPTDLVVQGKATSDLDLRVSVNPSRITRVRDKLVALQAELDAYSTDLKVLHDDPARRDEILTTIDTQVEDLVDLLDRAARFGSGSGGWGFAFEFKRTIFETVLQDVRDLVGRWTTRLSEFEHHMLECDAAGTNTEKLRCMEDAELKVRATKTVPRPVTPLLYMDVLTEAKNEFVARLTAFRGVLTMATRSIDVLRDSVQTLVDGPPPLSQMDKEPIDPSKIEDKIVAASADLMTRAKRLAEATQKRLVLPVNALLTRHDAAADSATRARLLGEAAKLLLGADAILIPEFTLGDEAGQVLQSAYDASVAGDPFQYQRTTMQVPLPADTWLYGVARVREKMRQWEQTVMLAGALSGKEPDLLPLQLPWLAGEHWLGLEYPSSYVPNSDRLLYTASFTTPFQRAQPQCGLLLDEWTEVIPADDETTGITFHYDRPNAEAPQTLLLVTPAAITGTWQWRDIVDAVSETLDRAKRRAVEPVQLEADAYAMFLPATIMATTLHQISIMVNLSRNNDVYQFVEEEAAIG